MTIDPSDRYFPSLAHAVRSVTGLDYDSNDYWKVYNLIYRHLADMPGAVQTGKNCHWKVPVAGLRLLGYRPMLDHTRPLAEILDEERRAEHKSNPEPQPEPEPEIVVTPAAADRDSLSRIASELLHGLDGELTRLLNIIGSKDEEIARLRAERDAARDRAAASEEHLRDLRSILDYATSPNQK